jgi:hypothetical protein
MVQSIVTWIEAENFVNDKNHKEFSRLARIRIDKCDHKWNWFENIFGVVLKKLN